MTIFQEALRHYARGSNERLIGIFALVGVSAVVLTFAYVLLIGRRHDSIWLSLVMPALMLIAGGILVPLARSSKDGFTGIAYAIRAIVLLSGSIISLLVTLVLLILLK